MEELIEQIYKQARMLGAKTITGEETLEELIHLFFSLEGITFCVDKHFPNISTIRMLKDYGVERYGVYIDCGVISFRNPPRVALIGRTTGTINLDDSAHHRIILMRGAKAVVNASRWSVCDTVVEPGCGLIKNTFNNAVIV